MRRLTRGWKFVVDNLDEHAVIEETFFFPALLKAIPDEDAEGQALIDHLLSDHQTLGTEWRKTPPPNRSWWC